MGPPRGVALTPKRAGNRANGGLSTLPDASTKPSGSVCTAPVHSRGFFFCHAPTPSTPGEVLLGCRHSCGDRVRRSPLRPTWFAYPRTGRP